MSTTEDFFGESKKRVEEYVQDRLLLLKLEAVEKGSRLVATMFSGLLIALFAFFILIFTSFMIAYLIGEALNHIFWGFGIVAAFYILLVVLIVMFRKKLILKPVMNIIIEIVFEKSEEEKKEEKEKELKAKEKEQAEAKEAVHE